MPPPRKILLADPDPAAVRTLGAALRRRGYQVHAARDASRALQLAILRFPDLVLLDEKAGLLDARTFVRILRTNPRTERIPVVLTGEAPDPERGRLGQYLRKPFNEDEVLGRIDQIFRRVEAARAVSGENADLSGNLAQIPLVDLLQILAMNRKSGRLEVERDGVRAEVMLAEGRIVDAVAGPVAGEKALFRLLAHREGLFAFVPGKAPATARIARRVEELVLEGLRQADEAARLAPALPAASDRLALAARPAQLPEGLHPVTAEVVALLAAPRTLAELTDRAAATDLEVFRAVAALLERGLVRREPGAAAAAAEAGPLLGAHELHALRTRLARGRAGSVQATGKVVVVGGGPLARRAALARFATLPGFAAADGGAPVGFGTVGRLELGDGLRVDVVALPGDDPALVPLWRPFAAGAVGALMLLPCEELAAPLAALLAALRLPLGASGPSDAAVAPELRAAPGGYAFLGPDPAEALRALLAGAPRRRISREDQAA
jgi:CheY-like chemotaxis protein